MNNQQHDEQLWKIAKRRAAFKRSFAVYFFVNTFLVLIWFFTTGIHSYFWPVWPMLGMGIVIALQYFAAYNNRPFASADQEYEKLKKSNHIKIIINMKKNFLAVALFATVSLYAQSEKYASAMKQNLDMFDSAKTTADFENYAASFERIGDAEKTQWLPYYWSALVLTRIGWIDEKANKDDIAKRIMALCDKADALAKESADKAEILTLRNMAATQQMLVDPQNRWMTYGQQASKYLQEATALNPNNPRIYYLQGMSLFNTPEQFGGGKSAAKPVFEKSVELARKEEHKDLYPHWGGELSEEMLKQIQ